MSANSGIAQCTQRYRLLHRAVLLFTIIYMLTWLKSCKYSSASSVSLNRLSLEGPGRAPFLREQEVFDRSPILIDSPVSSLISDPSRGVSPPVSKWAGGEGREGEGRGGEGRVLRVQFLM